MALRFTSGRFTACALTVLAWAVVLPGCGLFNPDRCDTRDKVAGRMTGVWNLTTVNGQSPGILGFPIPNSSDRLKFASLTFEMTDVGGCAGSDEERNRNERGRVVAEYDVLTALGAAKPPKFVAGTYTYYYSDGDVYMSALSKITSGNRISEIVRFTGSEGQFAGLTLRFTQQSIPGK